MKSIRTLVFVSLLVSMEIILTRFLSIQTPIVRIGFGFLPIALAGIMFGPIIGGFTAALADVFGMMLFSSAAGPYFPGFTISAFIGGAIYGLILHKKSKTIIRIALAVLLVRFFVDLGLNTVWISILYEKAWTAIIGARLIASLIIIPIQITMIYTVWRVLDVSLNKTILSKI